MIYRKGKASSGLVRKLDDIFSRYIRLRDAMPSGYVRCISCGRIKKFSDVDCGHYHSRRHMATRWDEDNCNAQCRYCNRFLADQLVGYRDGLIKKIGIQRFELLNVKAHQTKKWSEYELNVLIGYYREKVRELEEQKPNVK